MTIFIIGDRVLWLADDEFGDQPGTVTAAQIGAAAVTVKLDHGGTFRVLRSELRPLGTQSKESA